MLTCLECKLEKPSEEFKYNKFECRYSDYCKTCQKEFQKWYWVKYAYKLTKEDVQAMYLEQLGNCWICRTPFEFSEIQIDHCHKSGKVRGLLCRSCNWMLGHAKDNPETLRRAIEYLDK